MTLELIRTIDRSDLEEWAVCPMRALLGIGRKKSVGIIAEVGNASHDAISQTISSFVDSQGALNPHDLMLELETNFRSARPDLQPDVIKSLCRSAYAISRIIGDEHYQNILRYDGGAGELTGQLAHDIEDIGVRVTSELDLLMSTPSPEVVQVYDWKSGHKQWNEDDVFKSFQFQLQAWLVLQNYPDVQMVRVSIFNTRTNTKTYSVEFKRHNLADYDSRIRYAATLFVTYSDKSTAPTWPASDKCDTCPVALWCDAAGGDVNEVKQDPEYWVDQLVALEAKKKAIEKALGPICLGRGQDIVTKSGNAFGFDKPKRSVKPKPTSYSSGKESEE